ncbi:MAG: beta-lactamase family protein [Clostridia bacterium]|nr:beta-lactamase family protein [Clostridia bacterium]
MVDLNGLAEIIGENHWNIYRIAEMRGDEEPKELCLQKGNRCSNSYSVAKAFTVAAVGLLYDRGLLDPAEKITDILKQFITQAPAEGWQDVTLDHLMRHRCGLSTGFLDIDCNDPRSFGQDYLQYTLSQPLCCPPDTERRYSDGAFYLAARAVEARCGKGLDDFLWEHLLWPMGFREMAFSHCPMGHAMGATGLYLQAGDMVKLGGLWLNGGIYHGKRLLSQEWIEQSLRRGYEMRPVGNKGCYGKSGMNGQMLLVLPHEGRAIAWHGHDSAAKEALVRLLSE